MQGMSWSTCMKPWTCRWTSAAPWPNALGTNKRLMGCQSADSKKRHGTCSIWRNTFFIWIRGDCRSQIEKPKPKWLFEFVWTFLNQEHDDQTAWWSTRCISDPPFLVPACRCLIPSTDVLFLRSWLQMLKHPYEGQTWGLTETLLVPRRNGPLDGVGCLRSRRN